jgi:hypothetical protein
MKESMFLAIFDLDLEKLHSKKCKAMLIAMLLSDLSIQKLLMLISMLTCATSI